MTKVGVSNITIDVIDSSGKNPRQAYRDQTPSEHKPAKKDENREKQERHKGMQ